MTAGTERSIPLRVVVADDHPLFRDGLVAALTMIDGVEVVGTAADGEQAIALASELEPDVVLMDLAMPGVNGIEATRSILQAHPGTAVLVLTMAEGDDSLAAALRVGARGYLLKGADRQEIGHALRSVAAGQAVFGTGVADRILKQLTDPPRGKAPASSAFPSSPTARSRSSAYSLTACPTMPSPPGCTYPTKPCATTSATSSPRQVHPTGTPPPTWPAKQAWGFNPSG